MESNFDKLKSKLRKEETLDPMYSWEGMQKGIMDKMELKNDLDKITTERKYYRLFSLVLLCFLVGLVLYFFTNNTENEGKLNVKVNAAVDANKTNKLSIVDANSTLPTSPDTLDKSVIDSEKDSNPTNTLIRKNHPNSVYTYEMPAGDNDAAIKGKKNNESTRKALLNKKSSLQTKSIHEGQTEKRIISISTVQLKNNSIPSNSIPIGITKNSNFEPTSNSHKTNMADNQNEIHVNSKTATLPIENRIFKPIESIDTSSSQVALSDNAAFANITLVRLPLVTSILVLENGLYIASPFETLNKTIKHRSMPFISVLELGIGSNIHSAMVNQNAKSVFGYSASLLGRFSKNNYYASTDFDYTDHVERIDFEKQIPVTLNNQHVTTQVNLITGDSVKIYADSVLAIATRTVRHYNNYQNLSLALSVGYQKHYGRFLLGAGAGLRFSKLIAQSGRNIVNEEVVDFNESNANIDNAWKTGIFGEIMISYALTDRWIVGTRFNGSVTPSTIHLLSDGQSKKVRTYNGLITMGIRL